MKNVLLPSYYKQMIYKNTTDGVRCLYSANGMLCTELTSSLMSVGDVPIS